MSTTSTLPTPSIELARSLAEIPLDQVTNMSPYDLWKYQMESNCTEAMVDAMKRLPIVAVAMGKEAAQHELIPYLTTLVCGTPATTESTPTGTTNAAVPVVDEQPFDELLLLLGQQLIPVCDFLPHVVADFLPLSEKLASVEETVVRDQAVVVLCHLTTRSQNNAELSSQWMALVKRLVAADWFTAKVSAAGIIPSLLQHVFSEQTQAQLEVLALYQELCRDETPMVRRAAAQHLGHVLAQAGWPHRELGGTLVPVLASDEQDSVRLLAVASLAHVGDNFGEHPQWTIHNWLPVVKQGSTDMSWRVRNNLAKHFSQVASTLGIQREKRFHNEQALVMACFVALLSDVESEVRAAATGHLARMVAWGGPAHFTTHVQPLLPTLADDVVMEVRSKCALALMDAAHGGTLEDTVILQSFGPLLEAFLSDEYHEVQLQVLANLHKIARLLPGLTGVVNALMQMSKASNWRVREAIASLLPHLAEARGLDFFTSVLLEPAWQVLLLDPVATVRNAIVHGTPLLTRVAGVEWLVHTLLPKTNALYEQYANSYLVRMAIIQTYIEMAVQDEDMREHVVPTIVQALEHDAVPNVRMVAAVGLGRLPITAESQAALQGASQNDADADCRNVSLEALQKQDEEA